MKMNTLRLKRTTLAVLCTLLLSAAGTTKGWAQTTPKTLPYHYGWEINEGAWGSAGWTVISQNTSSGIVNNTTAANVHIGSYAYRFYSSGEANTYDQDYLISPLLDGSEGVSFSFWYRNYSPAGNPVNWGYVNSDSFDPASFDENLVIWANDEPIKMNTYNYQHMGASQFPEGTKYVVISCKVINSANGWGASYIDDVTFSKPGVKALPYYYSFERNLAPEGWTLLNTYQGTTAAGSTGICGGNAVHTNESTYPIADTYYGFQFYGNANYSAQTLISPEINSTTGFDYDFYYRTYSGTLNFKVGYGSTADVTTGWTWSETQSASNTWAQYQGTAPAGAKFMAVQFVSTSGYFFVDDFTFSEPAQCDAPTIDEDNITATANTITFGWTGGSGIYKVEYKMSHENTWTSFATPSTTSTSANLTGLTSGMTYNLRVQSVCGSENSAWANATFNTTCETKTYGYTFGFEDSEGGLNCWTKTNANSSTDIASGYARYPVTGSNKGFQFTGSVEGGQYLISPEFEDLVDGVVVSFYQTAFYSSSPQTFQVGYSTTTNQTDAFTFGETITTTTFNGSPNTNTTSNWSLYKIAFPAANIKYVAIKFTGSSYFFVDQFAIASLPSKSFTTEGDWAEGSNWSDGVVPTANDDVVVYAPATINSGTVAYANQITYGANGSITIKDGGQLQHKSSGLVATMEKTIIPYAGDKDNYYLLASPILNSTGISPTSVTNMLSNNYDLYQYDGIQENEWTNYKVGDGYNLFNGKGYLYANSGNGNGNVTLSFTGTLRPFVNAYANNGNYLTYDNSSDQGNLKGFNLVGNTFAANAYIVVANYNSGQPTATTGTYYYKLNATIGEVIPSTGAVAPLEGVFVQANAANQVAICYTTPQTYGESALTMNLNQAGILTDAAVVRFNEGNNLSKFQLNPNSTKLYIPQGGKDYAVVRSEAEGELPVNFRAAENGTYTLSFNTEDVEFSSLRLIDNMTGADVDLLSTPTYTFQARTTDYASRFRLVFSATGVEENGTEATFAYFNGSEWVVNANDNATLEVIDMMGRTVLCKDVARNVSTNGWAQGVYVIRLTDNNSVKTQKIVVR